VSRIRSALRSLAEDLNPLGNDRSLADRKYAGHRSASETARLARVQRHRREVTNWGGKRRKPR
jgi:hypothetical protein